MKTMLQKTLHLSPLALAFVLSFTFVGAAPSVAADAPQPLAFLEAAPNCAAATPLAKLFAVASPEASTAPEVLRWNPGEKLDLGTQVGPSCARYCRETCIANGEPCCIIDWYTCGCC